MTVPVIIFTVVYSLVLVSYFYTETSGKMYLRAPNKILLALMFFVFASIVFTSSNKYTITSYHTIFMAGLFLAMLGDIFLLFDFNRGGDFFLACNVCFIIYEISVLSDKGITFDKYFWLFIVALALLTLYYFLFTRFKNVFKLDKMMYPMLFYLASITTHGMMGIAIIIFVPELLLLGLGSLLFFLSDVVLTLDRFVFKNNWSLRANSALYFTGLLLMVLSMVV